MIYSKHSTAFAFISPITCKVFIQKKEKRLEEKRREASEQVN